jgi:hypothetical protein
MKIDKETIMLFGGGLLAGYLICKFMSKSSAPMSAPAPAPQGDAPVEFGADGLMRAENISYMKPRIKPPRRGGSPQPIPMGGNNPIPIGGINPIGSPPPPINAPRTSKRK